MASEVVICNLALARLGDEATVTSIDPPEGSVQAHHCAHFYPLARDSILELHDWRFATRRAALAPLATPVGDWAFAYSVPPVMVRALEVLAPDGPQPYALESGDDGEPVLLTDAADAVLRYTTRELDPMRFPPLFTDALAALLASHLAGPVIKGDAGKTEAKAQLQHFQLLLSRAKVSDANQQRLLPEHTPGWIAGR